MVIFLFSNQTLSASSFIHLALTLTVFLCLSKQVSVQISRASDRPDFQYHLTIFFVFLPYYHFLSFLSSTYCFFVFFNSPSFPLGGFKVLTINELDRWKDFSRVHKLSSSLSTTCSRFLCLLSSFNFPSFQAILPLRWYTVTFGSEFVLSKVASLSNHRCLFNGIFRLIHLRICGSFTSFLNINMAHYLLKGNS